MTTNSLANISTQQLRRAIELKEKIESLQAQLAAILGAPVEAAATASAPRKKGGMSAAGRARIAAAQRARWAKQKAANPAVTGPKKAKRKISAAARARMVAGAKARWAKIRAAK